MTNNLPRVACCFWGNAWTLSPNMKQPLAYFADANSVDFFCFSYGKQPSLELAFVKHQHYDVQDTAEAIYNQFTHTSQLPPWALSKSLVQAWACLQHAAEQIAQHEHECGQQYDQLLFVNMGIQMHDVFDFAQQRAHNLLYASSLSMFGFNHNWMLMDHAAFEQLTHLLADLAHIIADANTAFFQPGDLMWSFWQKNQQVCNTLPMNVSMPLLMLSAPARLP